jgi:hypothetical protein
MFGGPLVPMSTDDEIALAEQRVRRAEEIVVRQKQQILQLDSVGADSLDAKQVLDILETNVRIFEGHRDYLKNQREKK